MMCSVDDYQFLPEERKIARDNGLAKCVKCGGGAVTIARGKDPFCRVCFCTYFRQKFRTTLGKLRVIRPGEQILLAYSGGHSSSVLLRLLVDVLKDHSARKVPTTVGVSFIDEGGVVGLTREERCSTVIQMLSLPSKLGVPCSVVPLEAAYMNGHQPTTYEDLLTPSSDGEISVDRVMTMIAAHEEPTAQLLAAFDNFTSLSSKQSFLRILRQRILLEIAQLQKYTKVFVADNASSVAADLISNIAQGRGAALPLDTGFVDDCYQCVSLIRPLREFQRKEVEDFAAYNDIKTVSTPTLQSCPPNRGAVSIEGITEAFVQDLQAKFPSTVNTIIRTGEKLGVPEHKSEDKCQLCLAPTFRPWEDSIFTHLSPESIGSTIKLESLCYGCCLIVKDMRVREERFLPLLQVS